MHFIKIKIFCSLKDNIKREEKKKQTTGCENICNTYRQTRLASRIYKERL